jgi:branched-subunit amino acid aminotransferase/4-amino-4-deoxychorismate lyase
LKTGNYWASVQSLGEAKNHGADEALLFTPDDHLIGGCMANAFVHIGGVWRTPPKARGAREGVVRQWVLDHFEVIEAEVSRSELSRADAVFLTSSWIGVMPARQLDQRILSVPDQVLRLRQMLEVEMEKTGHTERTEAIG